MRYFPHTTEDIDAMLKQIGVECIDTLFDSIPKAFCFQGDLDLPAA